MRVFKKICRFVNDMSVKKEIQDVKTTKAKFAPMRSRRRRIGANFAAWKTYYIAPK